MLQSRETGQQGLAHLAATLVGELDRDFFVAALQLTRDDDADAEVLVLHLLSGRELLRRRGRLGSALGEGGARGHRRAPATSTSSGVVAPAGAVARGGHAHGASAR